MRRLFCCLLLLSPMSAHAAFLDCMFFDGFEDLGATNDAELAVLNVHNCARKSVDPAASSPIPPLIWDATVANSAQAWANNRSYAHGGTNGIYGQNIYAAAGFVPTLEDAANAWVSEQANYHYASNSCSGVCGHYTQMVWTSTTKLGCGQALCTTGNPFGIGLGDWTLIVCNYSPPGNYIGQRPY